MEISIAVLVLLISNSIVSYRGFTNGEFFSAFMFRVDSILIGRDYKRLITSGFLHIGWTHLIFNMITLVAFGNLLETVMGSGYFLLIYFASLIGGNLLSLFIHRNHDDYSAIGASGAVSGVLFSYIAMFPDSGINMFVVPFPITAWVYGVLYAGYTIFGIKSQRDNIGHDAHLGGALVGMLVTLALQPHIIFENTLVISGIVIPTVVFIYIVITRPHILMIDWNFLRGKNNRHNYTVDQRYNAERVDRQQEMDRLLDKIGTRGIDSLNEKEREFLNEYSKRR